MQTYLSDRRRVELVLPAQAFHRLAHALGRADVEAGAIARVEDHGVIGPALARFAEAAAEPLEGLGERQARKLLDRARRLVADLYRDMEDRPIASALRATVHLLQVLIERGLIELTEGSPFAEAYDALVDAVLEGDGNADLLDDVERSACKAGERMLGRLQQLGYYA